MLIYLLLSFPLIISTIMYGLPRSSSCWLAVVWSALFLTLAVQTSVAAASSSEDDWETFKARYGKKYESSTEDSQRRAIREKNLAYIAAHNQQAASGKYTYTLRDNSFSDWTEDEYRRMLGFRSFKSSASSKSRVRRSSSPVPPDMPTYYNTINVNSLPACINWTAVGWVGPVTNQGQCGSCWSYATTGTLQSQYYNLTGTMVQMSQQNLIDCSYPQGNDGCDGGNMQKAFWYIQTNGIESLSSYPDVSSQTGANQTCQFELSKSVTSLMSWRQVAYMSEPALQQAVALVGPVSAGIDAGTASFQFYDGGVYSSSTCGSSDAFLDHAILVVGYGIYNGQDYWLIQNSWGTGWGIGGYMMMARNDNNMCGIATDATFPVINQFSSPAIGVNTDATCVNTASSDNSATTPTTHNPTTTPTSGITTMLPSTRVGIMAVSILTMMLSVSL